MSDQAKNKTAVSVAMTTYNGGRFLEQQLESIIGQSERPVEIVVSDDQSLDNTVEILTRYRDEGHLTFHVNETRLGIIANFKKAVSLTKSGNLIALADQDDIWLPNKLEVLARTLETIDGDRPCIVYSDLAVINTRQEVLNNSFWNELGHDSYRHCLATLLYGNFVTGCSVLMNPTMREYFLEMPETATMHDAWLALVGFGLGDAASVANPLVHYRKHGQNAAFAASYKKNSLLRRRWQNFVSLFSDHNYLEAELRMAEMFLASYGSALNEASSTIIKDFVRLRGKSYISKKIAMQSAFKPYWV